MLHSSHRWIGTQFHLQISLSCLNSPLFEPFWARRTICFQSKLLKSLTDMNDYAQFLIYVFTVVYAYRRLCIPNKEKTPKYFDQMPKAYPVYPKSSKVNSERIPEQKQPSQRSVLVTAPNLIQFRPKIPIRRREKRPFQRVCSCQCVVTFEGVLLSQLTCSLLGRQ